MTIRDGGDPNRNLASMPSGEWARRFGASPPKRMAASWSGSNADPTEYKVAARCFAPNGGGPSGRSHSAPDPIHSPTPPDSWGAIGRALWGGGGYPGGGGKGGVERDKKSGRKNAKQESCV